MNFGHMSVRPSRSLSYGRAVILLLGRSRDAKAKDLDSFAGAMRRSANFPFIPFAAIASHLGLPSLLLRPCQANMRFLSFILCEYLSGATCGTVGCGMKNYKRI